MRRAFHADLLRIVGPAGTFANPCFEGSDLLIGKFTIGGHFRTEVFDGLDQQAFGPLFEVDQWSRFASLGEVLGAIEP